ncbi:MAG: anthranilate phosphoribosyltransferase [Desulfovibrio sp.]|nr:anthranilate phosphoribosyltransferase [Desulfovibrio sp.]
MFLLIDNYDSFTYNLVQAFYGLGHKPVVMYNDDPALPDMATNPDLSMVCISPGPGRPENAGQCLEFLKRLNPRVPVLGVCLGHQVLGLFAGARVEVGPCIMHGKQSEIVHDGTGLFVGLPNPMQVGRYHSLVVHADEDAENPRFTVTARAPEGEVMALRYNDRPWVGVQFHPESVLTPDGMRLLGNFPQAVVGTGADETDFSAILDRLGNKEDLTAEMASAAFSALMDGKMTPAQAGAFLMGLRAKGESSLELAHAVRAALARAVRVDGISEVAIDVVGTGGDGRHSFNCSTATCLTLAGMGYKVAKHGNRAVSSKCGAADALEGLGISLEKDPASVAAMIEKRNFAFMFAPYFHPSFANIGPIRKQMGIRTLFNLLGPMINPARPSHLLMGVARPELVGLVADTLAQSSLQRAAVVCGSGNYDEATPIGPAKMAMLSHGEVTSLVLDPQDYGIPSCAVDELAVRDKEHAVAVLKDIISGHGPRPMMDMVVLNVGLAIFLLEDGLDMTLCMARAREAVHTGVGRRVLDAA